MQTVLLLIFGTAAIISEFAFRIHNYRLDRQLEQQGGIYDETIYRNRHYDSSRTVYSDAYITDYY